MIKENKSKSEIELFVIEIAKELRLKHNLSQSELAEKLGVTPGFIGKVESQKSPSKYNLNHINQLSKIFEVSPNIFLPKNNF